MINLHIANVCESFYKIDEEKVWFFRDLVTANNAIFLHINLSKCIVYVRVGAFRGADDGDFGCD